MNTLKAMLNRLTDTIVGPLGGGWPGMVAMSLLTAVVILLIFKVTANGDRTTRLKNRAVGRLLEMAVYADSPAVTLSALGRVLRANLNYAASLWLPLILSLIPLSLLTIQVGEWYAHRPLRPGETAVLTAWLTGATPVMQTDVHADGSGGVVVETEGVRAAADNTVTWRIRAGATPGSVNLLTAGGAAVKRVPVGTGAARASPARTARSWRQQALAPSEAPLPPDLPFVRIALELPKSPLSLAGRGVNWLVAFFGLSLVFALLLKRPFRVAV